MDQNLIWSGQPTLNIRHCPPIQLISSVWPGGDVGGKPQTIKIELNGTLAAFKSPVKQGACLLNQREGLCIKMDDGRGFASIEQCGDFRPGLITEFKRWSARTTRSIPNTSHPVLIKTRGQFRGSTFQNSIINRPNCSLLAIRAWIRRRHQASRMN